MSAFRDFALGFLGGFADAKARKARGRAAELLAQAQEWERFVEQLAVAPPEPSRHAREATAAELFTAWALAVGGQFPEVAWARPETKAVWEVVAARAYGRPVVPPFVPPCHGACPGPEVA